MQHSHANDSASFEIVVDESVNDYETIALENAELHEWKSIKGIFKGKTKSKIRKKKQIFNLKEDCSDESGNDPIMQREQHVKHKCSPYLDTWSTKKIQNVSKMSSVDAFFQSML